MTSATAKSVVLVNETNSVIEGQSRRIYSTVPMMPSNCGQQCQFSLECVALPVISTLVTVAVAWWVLSRINFNRGIKYACFSVLQQIPFTQNQAEGITSTRAPIDLSWGIWREDWRKCYTLPGAEKVSICLRGTSDRMNSDFEQTHVYAEHWTRSALSSFCERGDEVFPDASCCGITLHPSERTFRNHAARIHGSVPSSHSL